MKVKEIMTPNPATLQADCSIADAAHLMRDRNIGAVIVTKTDDPNQICGIITDRDLVVRCIAEDMNPTATTLGSICSQKLAQLSPDDDVDNAVQLMRKKAIRRIPVTRNGAPVGILSLGDLAIERDPKSALGGISQAPANR